MKQTMIVIGLGLLLGMQGYGTVQKSPRDSKRESTVNAVQITPGASVTCAAGVTTSAMSVTMTTAGNPVQIDFTALAIPFSDGAITLRPTIDGADPEPRSLASISAVHFPTSVGHRSQLHFNRIYDVPAGTHTFGVDTLCTTGGMLGVRWMTVYEFGS